MSKTITIIGGTGAMGQLFAKLWQTIGFTVSILGRNDWYKAEQLLKHCDLALISVPINQTLIVIEKVTHYIGKNTILADFTSLKSTPLSKMLSLHTGPVLGLHPMFGPTILSPQSQVIINCGGRDENLSQWVIDSLVNLGFIIKNMDANSHDQAMNFIQGLEHFSTFTLGSFLYHNKQHPVELNNLASPIYQTKLALLGRIFDQDPSLYADIIMADQARIDLIAEYVAYLQNWVNDLKNGNREKFINEFKATSNWMGQFTHDSQTISDKFLTDITNSYNKFLKK